MKRVSLVLVPIVALYALFLRTEQAAAWQAGTSNGNKVALTMKLKVKAQPQTTLLVLDALLPRSISGRQKIVDIGYSVKPAAVYTKNGQLYGQFRIERFPNDLTIVIDVTAEVYRYDYATAARNEKLRQLEKKDTLKQWLIHEQYLETYSPFIQKAARGLSGKSEEETLRNCFDFVLKTLTKGPYDPRDNGAVWALQQKKGDCTDFADLFITLCRAKGIPARFCEGYLVGDIADTPRHDWAEVYTTQYGWVPFDPFHAYLSKATTFAKMLPVYLLLDNERRNGVLQNYHFWAYRYEGGPVQVTDEFRVNKREPLQAK